MYFFFRHFQFQRPFFGPGFDPAFLTTAGFAPFAPFLLFFRPAASSAFLFTDVLELDMPDDVKKLEEKT